LLEKTGARPAAGASLVGSVDNVPDGEFGQQVLQQFHGLVDLGHLGLRSSGQPVDQSGVRFVVGAVAEGFGGAEPALNRLDFALQSDDQLAGGGDQLVRARRRTRNEQAPALGADLVREFQQVGQLEEELLANHQARVGELVVRDGAEFVGVRDRHAEEGLNAHGFLFEEGLERTRDGLQRHVA
jgi:hypothetical protein